VYISIFTVDEPRLEIIYVDELSDAERASYLKNFENDPKLIKVVNDLDIHRLFLARRQYQVEVLAFFVVVVALLQLQEQQKQEE
jgi:hypothetical protein